MRVLKIAVTLTMFAGTSAMGILQANPETDDQPSEEITAEFTNGEGASAGSATLTSVPGGVLITAELNGLEPGWHGFHLHEHGRCEAPDFKSAGGHYNPHDASHGFHEKGAPHAGDLPNIHIDDNGKARVEVFAPQLSLEGGKRALLDDDGAALVVHSDADDYRSQPSGDAGSRVACASLQRS